MQLQFVQRTLLGGLLAACAGSCLALPTEPAQTTGAPETARSAGPPAARSEDAPQQVQPSQPTGWGEPAQQGQLSGSRGGTDTVANHAKLSAIVSNNSAVNVATGNNIIDGGSFSNMSGVPMVIQNTGANVLIQSATVINLQLR